MNQNLIWLDMPLPKEYARNNTLPEYYVDRIAYCKPHNFTSAFYRLAKDYPVDALGFLTENTEEIRFMLGIWQDITTWERKWMEFAFRNQQWPASRRLFALTDSRRYAELVFDGQLLITEDSYKVLDVI